MDTNRIRNFCIIAHTDHGKSTLADRRLHLTRTVPERDTTEQILDSMDLEREAGVTIKASAVRTNYTAGNGQAYDMNLIDTPGQVGFAYEVSRALEACEGAVLVAEATQGIEAQNLANLYLALNAGVEIIPVINKIDLPSARTEEVAAEVSSQTFAIPIQAAGGGRIISRATVRAPKKGDLAKCYDGDISREKTLLEKQTRGKRRMKLAAPRRFRKARLSQCCGSETSRL
jgi:small GTP-binding protein